MGGSSPSSLTMIWAFVLMAVLHTVGLVAAQGSVLTEVTSPVMSIIGGRETDIRSYPWMVVLLRKKNFRQPKDTEDFWVLTQECGGSIIAPNVVLTAQHCVPSEAIEVEYFIVAGLTDITGLTLNSPNLVKVQSVIRYPRFFDETYGKDVALLFLARSLELGPTQNVIPISTPKDRKWERIKTSAWITGWGETIIRGSYSKVLNAGTVQIASAAALRGQVGTLTADQICAMSTGKKPVRDICDGDSGGSLVTQKGKSKLLVGVASWNVECGSGKYPSVYVRISHFANWINRILAASNRPIQQMVLPLHGRTLVGLGQVQTYKVVIPRNLRAVHFQIEGTGNVELSVRFLLKAGRPDCTAGENGRCTFPFPMEGVYLAILTGLPDAGGYVKLDVLYDVYEGQIQTITQVITNIQLARDTAGFWSGFPVLPNTTFSFVLQNKPLPGAVQPAGVIAVNRVNVGNGIDTTIANMCPTGVVTCNTVVPRGATAVSLQIDGDKDFDTLYDLEVTYTRVRGTYSITNHPQVIFEPTEARRYFTFRNLPVGTEFGIRVHLHSGPLPLDVSIYFGSMNAMVAANDVAVVGETLFLSVIVPQSSTTAIVGFLGISARFSFESIVEQI